MRRLDPLGMARAVADLFARYNLPLQDAPDAAPLRYTLDRVLASIAGHATADDPRVGMLVLFAAARQVAERALREHLPDTRLVTAPANLAEDHAAAAVGELARQNAAVRVTLERALALARALPPTAPAL